MTSLEPREFSAGHWLLRYRARVYLLLNIALLFAGVLAMFSAMAPAGTVVYGCVLFMLCSMPLLWLQRLNDRYALLVVFAGTYLLIFGGLSLRLIILGPDPDSPPVTDDDFMTAAQVAVLLGMALTLLGCRIGSYIVPPAQQGRMTADWSNTTVFVVGLGCFIVGSLAMAYYAIVVTPVNTMRSQANGFANMGPLLTFAVMLGQMMQPLGVVMLAYGYAKNRTAFWLGLVLAVVFMQLVLGFITDTKGTALLGILLVAITQTLWDNKLPKGWGAGVVLFALLVFPVLQAARVEREAHGLDRQQAFQRLSEVLALAWESHDKVLEGKPRERSQTFLERCSSAVPLELVFIHAGVDTPFLRGRSLVALPFAFIPRLLLPDKEDVPIGQLYGHVFLHTPADDFTYIAFSQLGELYWNFGWPGVVGGMLLTGFLLGFTGANSTVAEAPSLTRLLVLLITIKTICFGFGGSITLTYVIWMRALAAIGLLHLIFARRVSPTSEASVLPPRLPQSGASVQRPIAVFPNMMS
jgi:hypothetical protein